MFLSVAWEIPFALAGEDVCAQYPSPELCLAELKEEFSHYASEVDVWWLHLRDDLGKKEALRVQAARKVWLKALRKKCGLAGSGVPDNEKALYCMTKGMYDCLRKLRDAVFRLENGESTRNWPPCASP